MQKSIIPLVLFLMFMISMQKPIECDENCRLLIDDNLNAEIKELFLENLPCSIPQTVDFYADLSNSKLRALEDSKPIIVVIHQDVRFSYNQLQNLKLLSEKAGMKHHYFLLKFRKETDVLASCGSRIQYRCWN